MTDYIPPPDIPPDSGREPDSRPASNQPPLVDSSWGRAPQTPFPSSSQDPATGWAAQSIQYQPMPGYPRQSIAVTALFLSILGFACCGFPSLIGALMGRLDINAIESGQTDPHNHSLAQAAFIVGIIGFIVWLCSVGFLVIIGLAGAFSAGTSASVGP